jgi:hypothetical protein
VDPPDEEVLAAGVEEVGLSFFGDDDEPPSELLVELDALSEAEADLRLSVR